MVCRGVATTLKVTDAIVDLEPEVVVELWTAQYDAARVADILTTTVSPRSGIKSVNDLKTRHSFTVRKSIGFGRDAFLRVDLKKNRLNGQTYHGQTYEDTFQCRFIKMNPVGISTIGG